MAFEGAHLEYFEEVEMWVGLAEIVDPARGPPAPSARPAEGEFSPRGCSVGGPGSAD